MQLSSLHLQQSSCTPDVIKGSRVMFKVPLYDCGTKLSSGAHFLSYSNVVANSASNQTVQKGISFDPEFYYPFSCRYTRDYSLHLISQQNVYKNETRKTGWWFFWFSFVIITVVKVILAVMKQLKLQCDSNPWPPRYRCSALPTEPWSLVGISTGFLCNCFSCFTTASITFTSILHPQWRRCISHTHLSNDFPHPTPPETTYHDTHLCYYSCHYTLLLLDLSWVELSIHVSSTSASFLSYRHSKCEWCVSLELSCASLGPSHVLSMYPFALRGCCASTRAQLPFIIGRWSPRTEAKHKPI